MELYHAEYSKQLLTTMHLFKMSHDCMGEAKLSKFQFLGTPVSSNRQHSHFEFDTLLLGGIKGHIG